MGLVFDSYGHLKPYDLIPSNLTEVKEKFVTSFLTSKTREEIFEGYLRYISDFQQEITPNFEQWIDGSFITKKINPNDIDIVTFIDYTIFQLKEKELQNFKTQLAEERYGVDAYIVIVYPETHQRWSWYKGDRLRFMQDWGNTLKNRAGKRREKGIISLSF